MLGGVFIKMESGCSVKREIRSSKTSKGKKTLGVFFPSDVFDELWISLRALDSYKNFRTACMFPVAVWHKNLYI